MNIISKILIGVGLLITVVGNLATYNAVRTAVNGMQVINGAGGIADVTWGMSSAHSYSLVSLVGCFLLIIGIALAALGRRQQS